MRARAFLEAKDGRNAAAEYQKIIDHRGHDILSPLWPLAHLELARSLALQGEVAGSRQAYDEFFRLWKNADGDVNLLIEARREYKKLG